MDIFLQVRAVAHPAKPFSESTDSDRFIPVPARAAPLRPRVEDAPQHSALLEESSYVAVCSGRGATAAGMPRRHERTCLRRAAVRRLLLGT